MVEKRQGLVGSERGEPERESGHLDGRWIQIDTKQAALRYLAAKGDPIGRGHIGSMPTSVADQRLLGCVGELTARGNKERTASHRGIKDAQAQDFIGGSFCEQRCQRFTNEI